MASDFGEIEWRTNIRAASPDEALRIGVRIAQLLGRVPLGLRAQVYRKLVNCCVPRAGSRRSGTSPGRTRTTTAP